VESGNQADALLLGRRFEAPVHALFAVGWPRSTGRPSLCDGRRWRGEQAVIASLGEALIDFTPLERDGHLGGFELHPGGSPYNVAIAVARLGHPSAFVGCISTDLFGRVLLERLEEEGVDTSLLLRGPQPSTLAFVTYRADGPHYSFYGEGAADAQLTPGDLDLDRLARCEALQVGSISLLREPIASTALGLVRSLAGRVTLLLDPNIRPALVADWDDYRARLGELARLVDVVRASDADLELWGEDPKRLAASGPSAVIVTRGERGSRLFGQGPVLDVPAWSCHVVDTVGAGDAFSAALLVSLARLGALERPALKTLGEDEWRAMLEFASLVAGLTCEHRGASPPTAADVYAHVSTGWA
jgi:fructokinase